MTRRLRAGLAKVRRPAPPPQQAQTITRRIARIEKDLAALAEQHEVVFRDLRHLQAGVDGLVRAAYLDPATLPYPERLTARRFHLHSQH
jgi:hypothetical protein